MQSEPQDDGEKRLITDLTFLNIIFFFGFVGVFFYTLIVVPVFLWFVLPRTWRLAVYYIYIKPALALKYRLSIPWKDRPTPSSFQYVWETSISLPQTIGRIVVSVTITSIRWTRSTIYSTLGRRRLRLDEHDDNEESDSPNRNRVDASDENEDESRERERRTPTWRKLWKPGLAYKWGKKLGLATTWFVRDKLGPIFTGAVGGAIRLGDDVGRFSRAQEERRGARRQADQDDSLAQLRNVPRWQFPD